MIPTFTSVDGTRYVVLQSSSKMPNSCWGKYSHSAVIRVAPGGAIPKIIRDTRTADVLWDSGAGFHGSSNRCAAERDYEAAIDKARAYAAARDARIARERTVGYLESLAERSGEMAA